MSKQPVKFITLTEKELKTNPLVKNVNTGISDKRMNWLQRRLFWRTLLKMPRGDFYGAQEQEYYRRTYVGGDFGLALENERLDVGFVSGSLSNLKHLNPAAKEAVKNALKEGVLVDLGCGFYPAQDLDSGKNSVVGLKGAGFAPKTYIGVDRFAFHFHMSGEIEEIECLLLVADMLSFVSASDNKRMSFMLNGIDIAVVGVDYGEMLGGKIVEKMGKGSVVFGLGGGSFGSVEDSFKRNLRQIASQSIDFFCYIKD